MARHFLLNAQRHPNLYDALKDQVRPDTPLACIWGDARIGSYADTKSFSIDNEARIQEFRKYLNDNQKRKFDSRNPVSVLGYGEDGKQWRLKLKKIREGRAVLEGPWGSMIMVKNERSEQTKISFWGLPYEGKNSGEPCFVFTLRLDQNSGGAV